MFNSTVPIGAGSNFPKDMQVRFITGARAYLKENAQLTTMKGARFPVEKAPTTGKGKGGGGRGGGGRGGGRSATPIISSSISEVQFFGDEGENAQDFESWVQNMQGEQAESDQLAAPAFASFFGGGDPPDEAELTEAIRDEIARASAVSAHMIYFDEDVARVNLLFAFFAPVMYLVFPEVRESKFHEHALPGAYYGPSRSTESENYCDVWNGTRFFAIHKGCLRIDERGVLALYNQSIIRLDLRNDLMAKKRNYIYI